MPKTNFPIEHYSPIDEISIEAIREAGTLAGHSPVNQLHVWWARRTLITSRAAILASILDGDTDHEEFISAIGASRQIVEDRRNMDDAESRAQ